MVAKMFTLEITKHSRKLDAMRIQTRALLAIFRVQVHVVVPFSSQMIHFGNDLYGDSYAVARFHSLEFTTASPPTLSYGDIFRVEIWSKFSSVGDKRKRRCEKGRESHCNRYGWFGETDSKAATEPAPTVYPNPIETAGNHHQSPRENVGQYT
ncbi:hypothetical protein OSB04_008561 [Centaurea solstitialis]|uniref:Uncharacterized protein n=1 Tax=Centaurea solstitialis TaxID=347529 RepID=A0AA38TZS5_9ASTR|nr:hypothetical protein OSB04_008561 [Centaurea solstitialis]